MTERHTHEKDGVAALLLAAGESSRMEQPKPLLEWCGLPLLQYQIKQLLETSVSEIVVVLGHRAAELLPLTEGLADTSRLHPVINPDYQQGKTTSIKAGLRGLASNPTAVMQLAVDQPRPSHLLQQLVDEHLHGGSLISVPSHEGKHGHPPLFDASLVPELLEIAEERLGIREVIERHRDALRDVPMASAIVLTNLNTPEDYRRAKELFEQPPPER